MAVDLNNLAGTLTQLGDATAARKAFGEAHRILADALGQEHDFTRLVQKNIAALD